MNNNEPQGNTSEREEQSIRQMPHNIEAEQALLGAILVNNNAGEKVSDFLREEHFFEPVHGRIYAAIHTLSERGQKADPVKLKPYFDNDEALKEIGGSTYLARLAASATTIINAADYGRTIYDLYLRRELVTIGENMVLTAYDSPIDDPAIEQIEGAEHELFELAEKGATGKGFQNFTLTLNQAVAGIEKARKGPSGMSGITTGIESVNKLIGGLHDTDLIILGARPGMGKALDVNSDILLPCGNFKKMYDIKIGDSIASTTGEKSLVTGVFPQGVRDTYLVTLSDGRSVKCDAEHLWSVTSSRFKGEKILKTSRIIALLKTNRYENRIRLATHTGNFGSNIDIGIDPWLLGFLLGDGCLSRKTSLNFSTSEKYILDRISEVIPNHSISKNSKYDFRIIGIKQKNLIKNSLSTMGLMGKYSYEKFIPKSVITSDRATRLSVLTGLLESDGWVQSNSIQYSTSSKQLADDIQHLVWSLGGCCSLRTRTNIKYTYKNKKLKGRRAYILSIMIDNIVDSIKSPRLLKNMKQRKKTCNPIIRSIKHIGKSELQCISVSHSNNLFITDNYVVTHNTALATNIALSAAKQHYDDVKDGVDMKTSNGAVVGIFSQEMSADQLGARILSQETGYSVSDMRLGNLNDDEFLKIARTTKMIDNYPLFIDDTAALTVASLRSRARRLKRRYGLGLIIIDYIQLMRGSGNNRVEVISEITRGLKALAKELEVPVLALSQLSRQVEQRENKRPMLSDLRESGSIEQDADTVFFLYREEYYKKKDRPSNDDKEWHIWDAQMKTIEHKAELIVSKNRHGADAIIDLHFDGPTTTFTEPAQPSMLPERFE